MTRLQWRRTWFQVHKWIGLALAILIIPLSLTGAALVWHDALDRVVNPQRFAVSGAATLSPATYVAAARKALKPGDRIAMLTMPEHDGPVVVAASSASASPAKAGPPVRTMVWLDPPTARVLDVAPSNAGLVRTVHMIHGSLMLPGVGRTIVGWIGVAMMVSAFTGIWLWWPTVGRLGRALRWGRHRNLDTNIHQTFGFWIALPLFVLSLTGAWISFPQFFGALGGGASRSGPDRAAMARAKPMANPARTLDEVVARAGSIGHGSVRSIAWPTDRGADWTVTLAGGGVKVADDTGQAIAAPARDQGGVAKLMRRIHDGTGMGIVWQTIIFIGGIIPAVLAVTGVVMWWRARGWKARLTQRQRQRARVAAE